jgi:hypothetical protein
LAAALAGRAEIVRMLLDRGVGADHPLYLPVGVTRVTFERVIFVTPLCAGRMGSRGVKGLAGWCVGRPGTQVIDGLVHRGASRARQAHPDPAGARLTASSWS